MPPGYELTSNQVRIPFPAPATLLKSLGTPPFTGGRLQPVSKHGRGLLQQADGALQRRRREVHVALRRAEVGVPRQLLDRPRRRPPHREVRAERVAQHVDPPVDGEIGASLC